MITERPRRNREDIVLQFLQVVNTSHLFHRVRIAEDEIAKTEMSGKQVLDVLIDFLGILVNKSRFALVSVWLLVALAGIEHQRHIFIYFTNGAKQFETRQFILLGTVCLHRETTVADDSQYIVTIFGIERPCFFIRTRQDNLGTSTHTQHLQLRVQCLSGKLQALLQDKLIEIGQQG